VFAGVAEEAVERRDFVRSAIAAAGVGATLNAQSAATAQADAKTASGVAAPEFYQLRRYALRNGPQTALVEGYFERALIPALGRLGLGPVGAFKLDVGGRMPAYYVLIPAGSAEAVMKFDAQLGADPEYVKAAAGFRDAPAGAPAFERSERTVLRAFARWPKLTAAKAVDGKLPKRIFQLRTYESPSQTAHARKVAMFNEAEIAIFTRTGLMPVFFGETLVGTRMPSLTYMLSFADTAELTARWAVFAADPEWKELSQKAGNTNAEIVSNVTNLYLNPLTCSQI
jgi:hypothetical protein